MCGALALCLGSSPALAEPQGWDLVWSDEFDTLDTDKWTPVFSTQPTNNSIHAYLPEQVSVSDGNLVLTSVNQSFGGLPYRSGQVMSVPQFKHGRFEIRADLPGTRGTWPAIWLLPDVNTHPWPSGGEIDIMENRGNEPELTSSAFHYGTNPPFSHSFDFNEYVSSIAGVPEDFHDGFHTYAVEWFPNKLRFFVDDVHYFTVHDADVGGFLSNTVEDMQIVINTAIGGEFLPNPNGASVWPQEFLVDYVRVYEYDPDDQITLRNAGFEDNGGSLAGWGTFGNFGPNVMAHDEQALEGNDALKVFGQFTGGTNYSGVSQSITVEEGDEVTATASAFVSSLDSLAGTNNRLAMKIEFYNDFGAAYGTSNMLGEHEITIANAGTTTDQWFEHELVRTAPAGAVEARLAFVFVQQGNDPGAVYVDGVSFGVPSLLVPGDADADGDVDLDDYNIMSDHMYEAVGGGASDGDFDEDGDVDFEDFVVHALNFGKWPAAEETATSIPEPAAAGWLLLWSLALRRSWEVAAVAARDADESRQATDADERGGAGVSDAVDHAGSLNPQEAGP